jgi:predicted PurR-regulated permease PerM
MAREPESPRRLIAWTLTLVVAMVLGLWLLWAARSVVLVVYTSGLLAIGISPAVRFLERRAILGRPIPRWVALLLVYAGLLGALAGLGVAVLPALVRQARDFARRVPELLDRGQAFLIDRGILSQRLTVGEALERVPGGGTDAAQMALGAVFGLLGGVVGVVTLLILTFYFVLDAEQLLAGGLRLVPAPRRRRAARMATEIAGKVSAWLGGQLVLSAVIGITTAGALWLLGVPYFYVLAVIAAIGELIPVVGPILAAIPAVAVALGVSTRVALFVALFFVVQQQLENHVLVPRLMAHQVGVNPIVVILALMIGSALLGVAGAILAVPTAAIVQVLLAEALAGRADS